MPAPVGVCTASTKSVENITSSLQSLLLFIYFFFCHADNSDMKNSQHKSAHIVASL